MSINELLSVATPIIMLGFGVIGFFVLRAMGRRLDIEQHHDERRGSICSCAGAGEPQS